jgi:dipeptidase D
MSISQLQPQSVWRHFASINAVPRASKKEERIIHFMINFGHTLGLETQKDSIGNVLIRKPATQGMERRTPIVLQSHLDMVHQKNSETNFDFDNQGIDMFIDGDWVKAHGTTLGADNGLGVATIMAILESKDISHPPIEALFTIDEETGMTGALGLQPKWLEGKILLNLDTEEDNEIGIGCAGGIDVTATRSVTSEEISSSQYEGYIIKISGLKGGHSGMDINLGLGNANKLMNRILYAGGKEVRLHSCLGGSLRNAIPRESIAIIAISNAASSSMTNIHEAIKEIYKEYNSLETNLKIEIQPADCPTKVIGREEQTRMIHALYAAHNGVFRMSPDIEGLVEASNNIARVEMTTEAAKVLCLTRSSVESSKKDVVNSLKSSFELGGFEVLLSGEYPGWTPNIHSPILKEMTKIYEQKYGEKPHVAACHAGLECGIIGRHYPDMDMVSFGPTIKGAHSPDEKASISSVQKFWDFTISILKNIPSRY